MTNGTTLSIAGCILLLLLLNGCRGSFPPAEGGPDRPYATSLLGEPLVEATPDALRVARLAQDIQAAWRTLDADPENEEAIIWYGRRLAYAGRHADAIATFTRGLEIHPESPRLLRHRGHRYLSTRRLELAARDFERAAELMPRTPLEVEPDGIPNAAGIPIGTTQGNVWYHLGLVRWLQGDSEAALAAFDRRRGQTDVNDDNRCSTAYWRWLALMRLGRTEEAAAAVRDVTLWNDVIENGAYRDLVRLFAGLATEAQVLRAPEGAPLGRGVHGATLTYGISMHRWFQARGDAEAEAKVAAIWEELVRRESGTSAFGRIAAEAELARYRKRAAEEETQSHPSTLR